MANHVETYLEQNIERIKLITSKTQLKIELEKYNQDNNDLVVLNHGFQKKTQKTPRKAIKLAEERKKDYLNRDAS